MFFGKFFKKKQPERKVRADKKREVRPTISIKLKEEVERLSRILDLPIKDLGAALCDEGTHNKDVVELLSPYFVDGVLLLVDNTIFRGGEDHEILNQFEDEETDRISIRFTQHKYTDIELLASHLGATPSRATAVLVDSAIRNVDIIEALLFNYNRRMTLDDSTKKELKKFMRFVNDGNPYRESSWSSTLKGLIGVKTVKNSPLPKSVMDKMKDSETYNWTLDDLPPLPSESKLKKKRAAKR